MRVGGEGDRIDADPREGAGSVFGRDQVQVVEGCRFAWAKAHSSSFFASCAIRPRVGVGSRPEPPGPIPDGAHGFEGRRAGWLPAEGRVNGA